MVVYQPFGILKLTCKRKEERAMPTWGVLWLAVISALLLIHICIDMREMGKLKDELEALKKEIAVGR